MTACGRGQDLAAVAGSRMRAIEELGAPSRRRTLVGGERRPRILLRCGHSPRLILVVIAHVAPESFRAPILASTRV